MIPRLENTSGNASLFSSRKIVEDPSGWRDGKDYSPSLGIQNLDSVKSVHTCALACKHCRDGSAFGISPIWVRSEERFVHWCGDEVMRGLHSGSQEEAVTCSSGGSNVGVAGCGCCYSLPCLRRSMWWHSLRAGPSFRPMYFMIMSLRRSIRALPSISCGGRGWGSVRSWAPHKHRLVFLYLRVFWTALREALTPWGLHVWQTASLLQWSRKRGSYWADAEGLAPTETRGLWWSLLLRMKHWCR